ncbi:MAG: endo-1,4-beta-glucanase [Polyangiaceae bacterium]|nr:endo-1,4-beta-glucanase [Polyangiaceae bacterium]
MRSLFVAKLAGSCPKKAVTVKAVWAIGLAWLMAGPGCSDSSDDGPSRAGDTGGAVSGSTGGSAAAPSGGATSTGGHSSGGAGPGATGGTGPGATGGSPTGGVGTSGGSEDAGGAATEGTGPAGGATTGGRAPTGGRGGAGTGGARPSGGSGGAGTGGATSEGSGGSSGLAGAAPTGGTTGTGTPEVRLIGRMDTSDAAGPKFAWSGSGMIARFSGTSVGVKLSGGQYTVVLDGAVKDTLKPTSNATTSIAQGLTAGEHTIELYRRTEANQGVTQLLGLDFGDGQLLAPAAAATRRLEVIGDSITCGYGNEGPDENCGFSADTENHYLTYEAIAARNLGAELVTIAWSGKGVVCNYGDDANSCTNPLPTYYDRTLPELVSSQWDFAKFQPDAVVINLGTNDLSTDQDPTQQEFESGYKAFLQHIREKNPNAYILCTNGPMLTGTDLDTVRGYIDDVVQELKTEGDTQVGSFEFEPQDPGDGLGCDWHPSIKTHQKMATVLETALKSALGW